MTVTAATFARDASERALKTLIQSAAGFGIVAITQLRQAIESDQLPIHWVIFAPIIVTALSVATSWLSRFRGDPNTASSSKAG